MTEISRAEMGKIAPLFREITETPVWSCLQGHMGRAWADNGENPVSAQIIVGDFCLLAGKPCKELAAHVPQDHQSRFIVLIPPDEEWAGLIEEAYPERHKRITRYAIKKEPGVFDGERLSGYRAAIPEEYCVKPVDECLYSQLADVEWAKDFFGNFAGWEDFSKRGLCFVALCGEEPVGGAASYSVYDQGIEIEIDTREDHRRKGLALACASALILECEKRGIYPSWDAATPISVALAEKLGYHFDREYPAYFVDWKGEPLA